MQFMNNSINELNASQYIKYIAMTSSNNLTYSILEQIGNHEEDEVKYTDLLQELEDEEEKVKQMNTFVQQSEFTLDDILALELDYDTNYIKKDLIKIAEYYDISIRKKNKKDIITDIVEYETNSENTIMVERRKELWFYITEIQEDSYLSKYLIFD